jgi:Mg2+/Co2+ transporter CorB
MDDISLETLAAVLAVLLVTSAFFSLAETAMMAVNRYRLRHRAQRGEHGARLTLTLLDKTDTLLGVILLGNNLINAGAATIAAVITERMLGESKYALALGTVAVTFLILVFSEITPKVIGATHADRIAPVSAFLLTPLLKAAKPVVWFVNLFVQALLKLFRVRQADDSTTRLTQEELRSLVLEGQYFRGKHRALLANLLDLEAVTVDDVMTPRNQIHAVDLTAKPALITEQLATSYHTRLPAYEGALDDIVGVIHLRQVVHLQRDGEVDPDELRTILRPAYFIPGGTPLLVQLQQFQTDRERLGLVVDEYGELEGLVTIEDIIEEIIGDFTTQAPDGADSWQRGEDGTLVIDGLAPLRTLNRKLGTRFPVDGPKTLNGLILAQVGDIPEVGTRVHVAGETLEVLQTQDRGVKVVRLLAPVGREADSPLQSVDRQASSAG